MLNHLVSRRTKNMGTWNTVKNYIDRTLEIIDFRNSKVKYVGRNASSMRLEILINILPTKKILEKVLET